MIVAGIVSNKPKRQLIAVPARVPTAIVPRTKPTELMPFDCGNARGVACLKW